MARFWISWIQPTIDHRPLNFPPNEKILGWWCSGRDSFGNAVLCAAVEADDEMQAKFAVNQDWPECLLKEDWRFCEERAPDWQPGDRFPLSDWMEPRFKVETREGEG